MAIVFINPLCIRYTYEASLLNGNDNFTRNKIYAHYFWDVKPLNKSTPTAPKARVRTKPSCEGQSEVTILGVDVLDLNVSLSEKIVVVFLQQPNLLELEAPIKICGNFCFLLLF